MSPDPSPSPRLAEGNRFSGKEGKKPGAQELPGYSERWQVPDVIWVLLLLLLTSACSGSKPEAHSQTEARSRPHAEAKSAAPKNKPLIESVLSTEVPKDTFGPYRALGAENTLLLWAAPVDGARYWYSMTTNSKGVALAPARRLAQAPDSIGLVKVVPNSEQGDFAVITSSTTQGEQPIETLLLSKDGALLRGALLLAKPNNSVVWVELLHTKASLVALWGVRNAKGSADLYSVELGPLADPKDTPKQFAEGAIAWQATALPDGVAVATVTPKAPGQTVGAVKLLFLDSEAHVEKKLELSSSPTAQADLDMARIGDNLICAWSDTRQFEPRVYTTAVDLEAKVVAAARPIGSGLGEQALVRVVPAYGSTTDAVLAWEEFSSEPEAERQIYLAKLDNQGGVGDVRVLVNYAADRRDIPEIEAGPSGVTVLTKTLECQRDQDCTEAPAYALFGADLSLTTAATLSWQAGNVETADIGWGLGCNGEGCSALATLKEAPAPIYTVALQPLAAKSAGIARRITTSSRPRAQSAAVVSETDLLAKVVALPSQGGALAFWLTYFDPSVPYVRPKTPAPDGKYAPLQALLQARRVAADGALGPIETISYRARSLAGIAAANNTATGDTLLAWVAIDKDAPHIFLTLLNKDGKKVSQRLLTEAGAEIHDLAVVFAENGYIISWIDARSGAPHAYVAKVDRKLWRVEPDRLLGSANGTTANVAAAIGGEEVYIVYSEARERPESGDIYLARVQRSDLTPIGGEQRISTALRRRAEAPKVAISGDNVFVTWIEKDDGDGGNAHVMMTRFKPGDALMPDPIEIVSPQKSAASSPALSCDAERCVLGFVGTTAETASPKQTSLFTLTWPLSANLTSLAGDPGAVRLLDISSASPMAAPSLVGNDIYFADTSRTRRGWTRRLSVEW